MLCILTFVAVNANPIITFFFQELNDVEKISQKLKKSNKLAKHTVNGIIQHIPVAGLLVSYAGYITFSNYNGEVILPRKHQSSHVSILITPEIVPVSLFENTILNWKLIPGIPAKMYSCEKKYNDKDDSYYWETQEVSLPENNIISLSTIIIIAKPTNIMMNVGITPTIETANLVLPDIYVKKGINIIENSSYMLTIRHLFKAVESKTKHEPFKILTHVID